MTTPSVIHFHKMHGLGNDFVVIDAINEKIDLSKLAIDHHVGSSSRYGCDQF